MKVCGSEGKQAENCGIRLFNADGAVVTGNGSGVGRRSSCRASNAACSGTTGSCRRRSLAAIPRPISSAATISSASALSKTTSAPARPAPRSAAHRPALLWFSTGRGSVDLNWIAGNRKRRSLRRRGGHGSERRRNDPLRGLRADCVPRAAGGRRGPSVTLPARLPSTPERLLGNVKQVELAHDAQGNETPFWPPDVDQGTPEPAVGEYFATVLAGRGMGQTRCVLARHGETYLLDRPWRVIPQPGALILVHTAYWRNHIVGNRTVDGMTGIQLRISCIENVISDNRVERMRKPGLFLYATCTTLASSMPPTWNHGIGPLYFNHVEGTRCDETSCGALVTTGDAPELPVSSPMPGQRPASQLAAPQPQRRRVDRGQPLDQGAALPGRLGNDRRIQRRPRRGGRLPRERVVRGHLAPPRPRVFLVSRESSTRPERRLSRSTTKRRLRSSKRIPPREFMAARTAKSFPNNAAPSGRRREVSAPGLTARGSRVEPLQLDGKRPLKLREHNPQALIPNCNPALAGGLACEGIKELGPPGTPRGVHRHVLTRQRLHGPIRWNTPRVGEPPQPRSCVADCCPFHPAGRSHGNGSKVGAVDAADEGRGGRGGLWWYRQRSTFSNWS